MRWYLHQKASGVGVLNLSEDVDWQMIVFDVDGTLMDSNGYPEGLLQRVRKLEELQLIVSLASGRTLPNVTPIQQTLAVSGFIVAENGGMVWDSRAGFDIARLADGKRARSAADWLATQLDGFDAVGIESNRWRETEWCLWEPNRADEVRDLLAKTEWADLDVVSTGFALHLTPLGINKASGLSLAFEQRGIDPAQVIAVGDASNDIPMFKKCGFSVAVNDMHDGVVEAADHLTKSRGVYGTIEFLDELIEFLSK
ncbi:MAG: HAD-IIB family hydrolase [Euryarchaeota archaeon]|jgi:hypothetical protein|nr:HAD-IIB family hydrolase [Euryarchaeota archaeon]MBT3654224.1 HAD-IIB family hydrolase [Euryarchaeota archaeon]MBT3757019.1 HAD-IIB family hydrolase [Euryarchaeota archaeon]MBT4050489.1 HAD-IIB family hydrolase [Euryarchaeota archaeon]MBT4347195.1 HAD-IIB family hydrolase [Euryarchaeota archaeon]